MSKVTLGAALVLTTATVATSVVVNPSVAKADDTVVADKNASTYILYGFSGPDMISWNELYDGNGVLYSEYAKLRDNEYTVVAPNGIWAVGPNGEKNWDPNSSTTEPTTPSATEPTTPSTTEPTTPSDIHQHTRDPAADCRQRRTKDQKIG